MEQQYHHQQHQQIADFQLMEQFVLKTEPDTCQYGEATLSDADFVFPENQSFQQQQQQCQIGDEDQLHLQQFSAVAVNYFDQHNHQNSKRRRACASKQKNYALIDSGFWSNSESDEDQQMGLLKKGRRSRHFEDNYIKTEFCDMDVDHVQSLMYPQYQFKQNAQVCEDDMTFGAALMEVQMQEQKDCEECEQDFCEADAFTAMIWGSNKQDLLGAYAPGTFGRLVVQEGQQQQNPMLFSLPPSGYLPLNTNSQTYLPNRNSEDYQPTDIQDGVLVAKKLTNSDASGRIILPRVAVEANISFMRAYQMIEIQLEDQYGRPWTFRLKSWANGPEHRRVYVLDNASQYIAAYGLKQDDVVGLCIRDGRLVIEAETDDVRNSVNKTMFVKNAEKAFEQFLNTTIPGKAMPLIIGNTGKCTRNPHCTKYSGHPGFCSGKKALPINKYPAIKPPESSAAVHRPSSASSNTPQESFQALLKNFPISQGATTPLPIPLMSLPETSMGCQELMITTPAPPCLTTGYPIQLAPTPVATDAKGVLVCTRTSGCTKPAGHQGFCSGHKGFRRRVAPLPYFGLPPLALLPPNGDGPPILLKQEESVTDSGDLDYVQAHDFVMNQEGGLSMSAMGHPLHLPEQLFLPYTFCKQVSTQSNEEVSGEGISLQLPNFGFALPVPAVCSTAGVDSFQAQMYDKGVTLEQDVLPSCPLTLTDRLPIFCNLLEGIFIIPDKQVLVLTQGEHLGKSMSPREFERLAGKGHAKRWRDSIHVDDGSQLTLGTWLKQNGVSFKKANSFDSDLHVSGEKEDVNAEKSDMSSKGNKDKTQNNNDKDSSDEFQGTVPVIESNQDLQLPFLKEIKVVGDMNRGLEMFEVDTEQQEDMQNDIQAADILLALQTSGDNSQNQFQNNNFQDNNTLFGDQPSLDQNVNSHQFQCFIPPVTNLGGLEQMDHFMQKQTSRLARSSTPDFQNSQFI